MRRTLPMSNLERKTGMAIARTLTRSDLAEAVHREVGLSRREAAKMVGEILEHVSVALQRGHNVKIVGFGSFVLRDKKQRAGRNPRNGAEIQISARRVLTFRASQQLRDCIRDE